MSNRGMSLIELLVVMAILSICAIALYNTFISQQKSYVKQMVSSEMVDKGELILSLIKREIMMAGWGVDKKMAFYIEDGGPDAPDRLYINDYQFLDLNELFTKRGYANLSNGQIDTLKYINHDLDGDGKDDIKNCTSGNSAQRVITDYTEDYPKEYKVARIVCYSDDLYSLKIGNGENSFTTIKGSKVAPAIYYEIKKDGDEYNLRRSDGNSGGCQPVADNVVDLQLAYKDKDGTWYCATTGPCPMSPFNPENISLIRVSIVIRSSKKTSKSMSSGRPAVENRNEGNVDRYSYKVYTTYVIPRNVIYK